MAEIAVIAAGGAIGAALRFGVSAGISGAGLNGAVGTAIANILGSFLLGLSTGHLDSGRAHPLLRPFLTVGVFGSFTTFSALALDNRMLASQSGEPMALAYLVGSLMAGLAAFGLGIFGNERLRVRVGERADG